MDGHNGRGTGSDGFFDFARIDIEGVGVDVHKYRPGADMGDGSGGGDEGEGRGDDFVAGADIESEKRKDQRVGAGSTGDSVGSSLSVR